MAIKAQIIINEVARRLNDENNENKRWSGASILECLNSAQKMIAEAKPEASIKAEAIKMVAGHTQKLPDDGKRFLALVYNAGNDGSDKGSAIAQMQDYLFDCIDPAWRGMTKAEDIRYYAPDPDHDEEFIVYPPNTGTGYAHCRYQSIPKDCETAEANIALDDEYREPLTLATIWFTLADRMEDANMRAIRAETLQLFQSSINLKNVNEETAK